MSINRLVEWKVILVINFSLFDTRNFRFGRFESADRQARIFNRVVKRPDNPFSKKIDSAKNYKCITPKRNYAYRVDINSRIVSHPGHVIRTYVTSHVKYHVI